MEILLEFFITLWVELAIKIVPDSKKQSPVVLFMCKLIVAIFLLCELAAFAAGSILFANTTEFETLGIVLLSSSTIIFIVQIVLGFVFYTKKQK